MNNYTYIYVLKLEDEKYYVGKAIDINQRWHEHNSDKGSLWTQTYKPIKIIKLFKVVREYDHYYEDIITIQMREKYGKENVRGGSWCSLFEPDRYTNDFTYIYKKYTPSECNKIHLNILRKIKHKIDNSNIKFEVLDHTDITKYKKFDSIKRKNTKAIIHNLPKPNNDLLDKEYKLYNVSIFKSIDGKYYVTGNQTHISNKWALENNVTQLVKVIPNKNKNDIRDITLKLMHKFGWQNVRGHAWSQINLKRPKALDEYKNAA